MDIKVELLKLGKKQVDLLEEIRKRGYPKLSFPQLSSYINGRIGGPQAEKVLELSREILADWSVN